MELIIYSRSNTSGRRSTSKTMNVSHNGGVFSFSSTFIKALHLKSGSRIVLANDKSNSKSWFVSVADNLNEDAFELRDCSNTILFRSQTLARKILDSFKEQKSIRFILSEEKKEVNGRIFYQLIPIKNTNK